MSQLELSEEQKLQNRMSLMQVIEEGNDCQRFQEEHPFSKILMRTLEAKRDAYKDECFDAAKDTSKNLSNFLGRMEGIEWVMEIIRRGFTDERDRALSQKALEEAQDREQKELDRDTHDNLDNPTYPGQKPGFV